VLAHDGDRVVMARAGHIVAALAAAGAIGCGGGRAPVTSTPEPPPAGTERLLAMLPQGAQVVIEVDLARLRTNPVVGAVVTRALADPDAGGSGEGPGAPATAWLRGVLRGAAPESPLIAADQLVLAAYGVGTAQAATLSLLAAPRDIAGAARVAEGVYALGPPEWVDQAEQRIAMAGTGAAGFAIRATPELLALRAHAMPAEAPGASLRMTAQLSFDARIALARQTGLDVAPAQISAWGDVADDLALVIDCDASDPGNAAAGARRAGSGDASRRLTTTLRTVLTGVAELPAIRRLGLPPSIEGARLIARGSWVRAIIAVGPQHLHRVVERAAEWLGALPGGGPS
jgi:hypothetical protein